MKKTDERCLHPFLGHASFLMQAPLFRTKPSLQTQAGTSQILGHGALGGESQAVSHRLPHIEQVSVAEHGSANKGFMMYDKTTYSYCIDRLLGWKVKSQFSPRSETGNFKMFSFFLT
jgi:hypothetical protein